jgi:hypothetical protein
LVAGSLRCAPAAEELKRTSKCAATAASNVRAVAGVATAPNISPNCSGYNRIRPTGATFRYKHELDPDGIPQFGLIAEQVEKVDPDLVVRDDDGRINSVRCEAVNAMLLNEFLKEHRKVQEQQAMIVKLRCIADNQRAINTKQDAIIA